LELAKVGTQLDILHCVMFPNPNYPLPMFGTDLVGGRGQISAAIADLSPTSPTHTLPSPYIQRLKALPEIDFSQPRELPGWGNIFSEFCLFIRPNGDVEEELFLSRVESYLEIHCQMALAMQPVPDEERLQIIAGQRNYCTKQQQNDKTRRVLEKAFGEEWAESYLTNVLFDFPEN
jgi:phycocyanobilin:ferredoxin oxidoreductase